MSAVGDDALGLEMIDALSGKNVKHHIEKSVISYRYCENRVGQLGSAPI